MAAQEKTEEPTAKRLQEARQKGQIAVSPEIGVALSLAALFGALSFAGPWILNGYEDIMRDGLALAATPGNLTASAVFQIAADLAIKSLMLIAPLALGTLLLSVIAGALQTRFNFAFKALKPDFKKLNPLQGIKRVFGPRGLIGVTKELVKVTVIGAAATVTLWPKRYEIARTVGMPPADLLPYLAKLVLNLGFSVSAAYLLIAVADYMWQRYQTKKELRMTKEEVKQEAKQTDMAPEIKQAIKQKQVEASRRRMMHAVPDADVIITNPTHYAVALKYEAPEPAPKVIAKGQDRIALQIRERARDNDVEIIENPPLARSLHAACDIGEFIPEDLFVAVAEILAFVYAKQQRPDAA